MPSPTHIGARKGTRSWPANSSARSVICVGNARRYLIGVPIEPRAWGACDERPQEHALRPYDANFLRVHFDLLGERAQVIAPVAAALCAHTSAGLAGEGGNISTQSTLIVAL